MNDYYQVKESFLQKAANRRKKALDLLVDAKSITWYGSILKDKHFIHPVKKVTLQSQEANFSSESVDLTFGQTARSGLLQRLGLPISYLNICPNDLEATNINYWLQRSKKEFVLRTLDEKVRACVTQRFDTDKDDYLAFPSVFNQLEKVNSELTDSKLRVIETSQAEDGSLSIFRCIFTACESVFEGSPYSAGVQIINSETGQASLSTSPYISFVKGRNYNFIPKDHYTKLRHTGSLDTEKISKAIQKASEVAQLGLVVLLEQSKKLVLQPIEELEKIVSRSVTGLFTKNIVELLEDELNSAQVLSRLELAMKILDATQEMPTIKRYKIEKEMGSYLGLFKNQEDKIDAILDDAAKGQTLFG